MSDVITGIGELMTQDGDHTVLHDAALVIEEGLVACGQRLPRPRPITAPISAAGRSSPAGSTRTATSSSTATAAPSSRRGWPARATPPAASPSRPL